MSSRRAWGILAAGVLLLVFKFLVGFRTTHDARTGDRGAIEWLNVDNEMTRSEWLKLHPPRKARHDAELLRRRMLSTISELGTANLTSHIPQIVASLDNGDAQVRQPL